MQDRGKKSELVASQEVRAMLGHLVSNATTIYDWAQAHPWHMAITITPQEAHKKQPMHVH
jgi:hypothetical protein